MKGWLKMKKVLLAGCVVLALAANALAGRRIEVEGSIVDANDPADTGTAALAVERGSDHNWSGSLAVDHTYGEGHYVFTVGITSGVQVQGTITLRGTITSSTGEDTGLGGGIVEVVIKGGQPPAIWAYPEGLAGDRIYLFDIDDSK